MPVFGNLASFALSRFFPGLQGHLHMVPHSHPHIPMQNSSVFFNGISWNHTIVYLGVIFLFFLAIGLILSANWQKKQNTSRSLGAKGFQLCAFFLCSAALLSLSGGCSRKSNETQQQGASAGRDDAGLTGKVLHLMVKDNIKSGDPASILDVVSAEVINQIMEPLYQYDYFSASYRLQPLLAESLPIFSKDQKTVTIKIKKGVMFHNDPCFPDGKGRELTAQDFLFAWKRMALTDTHAEGTFVFDGHFEGYHEFLEKNKGLRSTDEKTINELSELPIPGLQALDNYTIQIKLIAPYPQLIYLLAHNFTAPIAKEALKKYGPEMVNHPIGTGPFKVTRWEPQNKVILAKNENFRAELFPKDASTFFGDSKKYAGQKLPLVDHIVFRVIHEEQPRWLEYIDGNLDQIEIPKDNISVALNPADNTKLADQWVKKGLGLSIDKGNVYWYFFFNMHDSVVGQNKLLRQAISSAIDRKEWLRLFRNDRGDIATELNPTGVVDRCGKKALTYGFDLERAKKLLAQAGFPGGKGLPELKFDLRGANTANRQIGEFIKRSLEVVGIRVEVIANTFPSFLDKRNKKNLQIAYGGWVMDYPDPENNFALYFSKNEAPGPNESNFNHAKFDEIYQKFVLMPPGAERKKLVCELEDILQEEMPAAFGFYENVYRAYSKRIKNYRAAEMIWNKYKYVDVTD